LYQFSGPQRCLQLRKRALNRNISLHNIHPVHRGAWIRILFGGAPVEVHRKECSETYDNVARCNQVGTRRAGEWMSGGGTTVSSPKRRDARFAGGQLRVFTRAHSRCHLTGRGLSSARPKPASCQPAAARRPQTRWRSKHVRCSLCCTTKFHARVIRGRSEEWIFRKSVM
jgi:hypothetical protein